MTVPCLLVLLALPGWASSFCVSIAPLPLKASALALGTGKDFGLSELIITHATGAVSRAEIVERLPFSPLFQWQAIDVLSRTSANDQRSIVAAYFGGLKDLGPSALVYGSARAANPYVKGVLLGVGGLWALAQARSVAKAPNPSKTLEHVLPDAGVLGDWSGVIVTGLRHDAQKIGPICDSPSRLPAALPIVFDRTVYEYALESTPALAAWRLERIQSARRVMATPE